MPRTVRMLPAGETVRLPEGGGTRFVLVAGPGVASRWWLSVLAFCPDPAVRYWMSREDLEGLLPRLHVRPAVTPSFLVLQNGWPVDWFPAPLPPDGIMGPDAPMAPAVEAVAARLAAYRSA